MLYSFGSIGTFKLRIRGVFLTYLAIIPARGGSKGIPQKNLVNLKGNPLLYYAIKVAEGIQSIKEVTVSSDDDKILSVATQYGAFPLKRPIELSLDSTLTSEVIHHTIVQRARELDFQHIILLQPTSPLRTKNDVEEAIKIYEADTSCDALISVYKPSEHPFKGFVLTPQNKLEGYFSLKAPFSRRQDLPEIYMPNGAIYIFSVEKFMKEKIIPQTNIIPYIMPAEKSIDIDTFSDLEIAEVMMRKYDETRN